MFKVNYEVNYLLYTIIAKNCLETNFQFLKSGMVLGLGNVFPKSIAKKISMTSINI